MKDITTGKVTFSTKSFMPVSNFQRSQTLSTRITRKHWKKILDTYCAKLGILILVSQSCKS